MTEEKDPKRGRIIIRDHPVKVEDIEADKKTLSGGVDLVGIISMGLDADEHVVWHGHPPSSMLRVRFALSLAVMVPWSVYIFQLALRSAFIRYPQITVDSVVFILVGLSQLALACATIFFSFRALVATRFTLYAITNKRAIKIAPLGNFALRRVVPTRWEIKSCTPPAGMDATNDGYKATLLSHVQTLARTFLIEFDGIPGAKDALAKLQAGGNGL